MLLLQRFYLLNSNLYLILFGLEPRYMHKLKGYVHNKECLEGFIAAEILWSLHGIMRLYVRTPHGTKITPYCVMLFNIILKVTFFRFQIVKHGMQAHCKNSVIMYI